ncbi:MAG TPA: 6-phosphogluconolactonase [Actinomycetales bacterium]|nr:6-phosphogluconolactonase [Actinomycetales bacterium]
MHRVIIHPTAELTARSAGMRLLLALVERQALEVPIHVALTGGSMGIGMLEALRNEPLLEAVDWSEVHLWWGDERFAEDSERNASQAREALLDSLPIPAENIHEVARPGDVETAAVAAEVYADEVAGVRFAIVVLGMGPDGHVASLFPGREEIEISGRGAVPVADSPKPPPERVSLSREKLEDTDELWFVAAGADKAEAVAASLAGGEGSDALPVARVRGDSTLWLLDAAAAGIDATDAPGA